MSEEKPSATPHESRNDDAALMNVIDLFGIRHGGAMVDPAQPYWIELAVNGHGRTTCYGKTARIAAERALLKLREWGEFTQSANVLSDKDYIRKANCILNPGDMPCKALEEAQQMHADLQREVERLSSLIFTRSATAAIDDGEVAKLLDERDAADSGSNK